MAGAFFLLHLHAPPLDVVVAHAAARPSEGILEALGGLYMHDSANELRRIPLPRTPLNKGKKSGDRRVRSSIRERGRCTCASHSRADVFVLEGFRARSSELRSAA